MRIERIFTDMLVHGPPNMQLGFLGAPIATASCYNFVAVSSALYILLRPRATTMETTVVDSEAAKHNSERPSMLRGLGLILFLGTGSVGEGIQLYHLF